MRWAEPVTLAALVAAAQAATQVQYLDIPPLPTDYRSPDLPAGQPLSLLKYWEQTAHGPRKPAPKSCDNAGGTIVRPIEPENESAAEPSPQNAEFEQSVLAKRASSSFWMSTITHGSMLLASTGYQFYRDVTQFGAKGDGVKDDTAAINRAVSAFSSSNTSTLRCGETCGSTTTLGALVFFPPGTYIISSPIVQYYYTQFVGDPTSMPTIKGSSTFQGSALIDTDVYIPGGGGNEWYINQNQLFRQIRNFKLDLTEMPNYVVNSLQPLSGPVGIHWQVAQATSLQNVNFVMPTTSGTNAIGIYMENGSGGIMSDLTFFGGIIGFKAGSQQYTARNLYFKSCQTAIAMVWDWGFTWKNLTIDSCNVGTDCTAGGSSTAQGTGSLTDLDSEILNTPYGILLNSAATSKPSIVLDNLLVQNSVNVVMYSGGSTVFAGSSGQVYFTYWAMGYRYTEISGQGSYVTGLVNPAPNKPPSLLDPMGRFFTRSRPQYQNLGSSGFVVATAHGIQNDGSGDQSTAINTLLQSYVGTPVFFPAGIYQVRNTVFVPVGSIIVGEGWSQIMADGSYFQNPNNTQVMVKVGNIGDSGVLEMTDMLFTVKGPTAGAVLMQWNVHESTQGSAGMWDCHFRVGGAAGTSLQLANCPAGSKVNSNCIAASLLFHITDEASSYFENVWAWVADHDLDVPVNGATTTNTASTQLNIFAARGVLIESQGPCWFHGIASEHSALYQYQLDYASNIFFGHMQTETPYFQPQPAALSPFQSPSLWSDPTFVDCKSGSYCEMAWALRVLTSTDVLIYGAGFYSFYNAYSQTCLNTESCQLSLIETSYSQDIWIYNIYTVGTAQVVTPRGGIAPVLQADTQAGFSTKVSAWLVLGLDGGELGGDGGPDDGSSIVYIDPIIWIEPTPTLQCYPPCTYVIPPSTLPSPVTISVPAITTTLTINGASRGFVVAPTPVTTSVISFSPVTIGVGETKTTFAVTPSLSLAPISVGGTTIYPSATLPSIPYPGLSTIVAGTVPAGPAGPVGGGGSTTTTSGVNGGQPPPVGGGSTTTTTSSSTVIGAAGWPFATLPTTVVTSGSYTQTWFENQITSLSSLSTTSTLTTDWTYTKLGGSATTTSIVITVQTGGFYWSPVPPGNLNLPKLTVKGPAPLPTPSCFKLFDIFSIDCPPDKGKKTTHHSSGAPTPSCTASCGTYSSSSESTESTTCATQTRTTCSGGKCNTYVGCACPTTTATDYWISCSSSTCTTTSTLDVTGCYVTGTTYTTGGAYCLASPDISPEDEQGEGSPDNVVLPAPGPQVVFGTQVIIAPLGASDIVFSGVTIPVPTVNMPEVTVVLGVTITVYPGAEAPAASIPPPIRAPSPLSSTTTTTTTQLPAPAPPGSTPPPPPPPPPPPSPSPSSSDTVPPLCLDNRCPKDNFRRAPSTPTTTATTTTGLFSRFCLFDRCLGTSSRASTTATITAIATSIITSTSSTSTTASSTSNSSSSTSAPATSAGILPNKADTLCLDNRCPRYGSSEIGDAATTTTTTTVTSTTSTSTEPPFPFEQVLCLAARCPEPIDNSKTTTAPSSTTSETTTYGSANSTATTTAAPQ